MNSITSFTPADIISLHQGQPVTTSLKVAEVFGKQHKDVLRKIEQLDCPPEFASAHFCAHEEIIQAGAVKRASKFYEMTKDGFMLLVMGFTGKPAMATKIAFINAFNWMAEQLTAARPAHGLTHDELCDLAWCWRAADKMWHFAQSVENLLDAAEHREAPNCYSIVREYRFTLAKTKAVLINHTRDLPPALYADEASNWARVLRPLHDQPRQIGQGLRLR